MDRRVMMNAWVVSTLLLAGCSTVNFTRDLSRASALVESHSGLTTAWGDESVPPAWDGHSPLSSTQAATVALRNGRELRVELELIAAARADLVQSGLLPNPVLSLTLRLPLQGGNATFDAGLVQQFTSLWLRPYREGAAEAELNRVVLSASDRALRLVADARRVHAQVLFGQRGVALVREDLALLQRSVEATEGRVRAGEATTLDVNRVRQQLLGLQAELQREGANLEQLKRELLGVIGMADAATDWDAIDEQAADSSQDNLLAEAEVVDRLRTQRLDVVAARFVVEERRQELEAKRWLKGKPIVDAGASFEATGGKSEIGPAVDLTLPVFDTGAAQFEKARAELRAADARAKHVEQVAIAEARRAWSELQRTRALSDFYRTQVVALAEDNLARTQSAIRAGTTDQTVVLEAQQELIEARRTLNTLDSEMRQASISLEYAMGGRKPGT